VRENEGVAARILLDFDADAEKIRGAVLALLGGASPSEVGPSVVDEIEQPAVTSRDFERSAELRERERQLAWQQEQRSLAKPAWRLVSSGLLVGVALGLLLGWLIWS
jgi:hypothetical protein